MIKRNKCYRPQLVIPQTFEQCFTYEEQVLFLKNEIDKLKTQVATLSSEVAKINANDTKS